MSRSETRSGSEKSIAELGEETLTKIQRYGESEDPRENLIALNGFVFIFVLGIAIASWVSYGDTIFSVSFLLVLVISLIFAAVLGLPYLVVIETMSKLSSSSQNGLRLSIIFEFFALTVVLGGLLFGNQTLVNAAFLVLVLQIFIPLVGGVFPMLDPEPTDADFGGLWGALGKWGSIITVGSFAIDLLLFVVRFR